MFAVTSLADIGRVEGENDRSGDRTHDLKIKSLLLYQLSYPVSVET